MKTFALNIFAIIITAIGVMFLLLTFTMCSNGEKTGVAEKVAPAPKSRIVLKCKEEIMNAPNIYIYEIDSVEYIISSSGGIYPLNKKSK